MLYVVLYAFAAAFFMVVGVFIFLFCFTFLRHENDCDNLDSPQNDFLGDFKPRVKEAMDFAENTAKRQVSTKSFDNLTLVGDYYKNGASKNTVILFHGYRSSPRRDLCWAVRLYYKMGFNVLLVDQRAHHRSGGRLITFGIKERYDVKSWVQYVLDTFGNDINIVLEGLSMGGTTVLLAASVGLPQNVKCIISDCGFTSPAAIIKRVSQKVYNINSELVIKVLDIFCRIIGNFSIYATSTIESVKNTSIPIFFCHGKADNFVPHEMSKETFAAANCEKQIHLSENAGHGTSFLYDTEILTAKLNLFITSHIC